MAVNVFARSDQPYMSRQGFRMLGNHRFLEMAQDRYVAFDLETTGFHPRSCRILELGAVRVVRGRVEAEFDMLVDPECAIPDRITELTGINQMMVMGQPLIGEALEAFLDFAGRDPLIAHNADFDLSFLKYWTGVSGLAMPDTYADSLEIAREYWPETVSHKLQDMARLIGYTVTGAHRSVDDCLTLKALIDAAMKRAGMSNPVPEAHRRAIAHIMRGRVRDPWLEGIACIYVPQFAGIENLWQLRAVMEKAWCRESSAAPEKWTDQAPWTGQADVTARLVYSMCGGGIVRTGSGYANVIGSMCRDILTNETVAGPGKPCDAKMLCGTGSDYERFRALQRNIRRLLTGA